MAVTIQMIETKEFQVVPNSGYDPDEVDRFLDEVVDELERLQKEIKTLRQDAAVKPRASASTANTANAAASEETIRSMLVNAQRVCDDTISDAKKRADDTVREARDEAEQIIQGARAEEQRLTANNDTMRATVANYRADFRRLIEDQMRWLKEED
ncbi:hypothetical protein AGMMS49992_05010 [Clostridia bacterium]|nr:hypothetical protein AGMMS49992_05010 [Clostridia bacterium]